jgi:hypothetical protein
MMGDPFTDAEKQQIDGVLLRVVQDQGQATSAIWGVDNLQERPLLEDMHVKWGEYLTSVENAKKRGAADSRRINSLNGSDIALQGRSTNKVNEIRLENEAARKPRGGTSQGNNTWTDMPTF